MAHQLQERYSGLVLAKMRDTLILKNGIVFNNSYEGKPTAGSVKIPVRDTEVAVGDYDRNGDGVGLNKGSTSYQTLVINKDKFVNEIIDSFDAAGVPDNLIADRLDSAGYSLAKTIDNDGAACLINEGTKLYIGTIDVSNVYEKIVDIRTTMTKANVPSDGRYLLVSPDCYALLLKDKDHFVGMSSLSDEVKQTGALGRIAGFTVYEYNTTEEDLQFIAGHPRFATRVNEFSIPIKLQDLSGSGKYIGASAVQGRMIYAHKVLRTNAIISAFSGTEPANG